MRWLDLIFPPLCLHCKEKCAQHFCPTCASSFELIDPLTRCPFCFGLSNGRQPCEECTRKKRWHIRIASSLDYFDPVQTLVKRMKYGRMPYLARTAAAFMVLQWTRLKWESPDLIVPVPRHLWAQGLNHAALLGKEMGRSLNVKVASIVKRRAGDLAQASLTAGQRELLTDANFYLKERPSIEGKTVLIVDDVMTTGTSIRHTAEALRGGLPKKIYALTFARSI